MVATFTSKTLLINGQNVLYDQQSLKVISGYGETTMRAQVSGKTVVQIPGTDLTKAVSKVMFDLLALDSDSDKEDVKTQIRTWKQASGGVLIQLIPDGVGKNQNFQNMFLTNDPEINETPNGTVSFTFEGKPVQLT